MTNNNWYNWVGQLVDRLQQPLPGIEAHKKMMPSFRTDDLLIPSPNAKVSGVLLLIYPNQDGDPMLVLIQRTIDGGSHSGQIAFPGGKQEKDDEDIIHTALREANEEIGVNIEAIKVLGQLSRLFIHVSNYNVFPVVGVMDSKPILKKSDEEVTQILQLNLNELLLNKRMEKIRIPSLGADAYWKSPVYKISEQMVVWGATAMILSELDMILNK